jgi:catechol 2,3-dioxygenase
MPAMTNETLHPAVRVGHVHLRVVDLDRSLAFYRDALGFGVTADGRPVGLPAAFLAAGDYHHHIGLNTFEGAGAPPPDPAHAGLYHVAFVYPDRRELARAVQRLVDHGFPPDHATDHGATVSVYL